MIFAQGKWQGRVDVAIKQLRNDRIEQGGYEKAKEEFIKVSEFLLFFVSKRRLFRKSTREYAAKITKTLFPADRTSCTKTVIVDYKGWK